VIDARIVDDACTEAFDRIEICQERYSAGGRPRFWINRAVHRDLRQVCEGDDVVDGVAVNQWRSKPDGQTGEREAFNVGIDRDGCQAEVENGASIMIADISIGVVQGGTEISKVAADRLPFQLAGLIKVAKFSELSVSPPRLSVRAQHA